MSKHNKNILIVEQFINGLKNRDIDQLPLHQDVILHSPLRPGHIIKGRSEMRKFLADAFPKIPITGAVIEKHITQDHCVCTHWELHVNEIKVPIFDYFEIEDDLLTVIRPYFDPAPLNKLLAPNDTFTR